MSYITNLQIQDEKYGRFGNQLFKIAATIGTAKNYNVDYLFPEWKYSFYFKNESLFVPKNIIPENVYNEPSFSYNKIPFNGNLELRGYFYSEKYFENYKNDIRTVFSFKNEIVSKIINNFPTKNNCCAVHFRHGDKYDRQTGGGHIDCQDRHPIMTPAFYNKSIKYMKDNGIKYFYFFYDHELTKKWIQENIELNNINYYFVDEEIEDIESFILMSKCDHNIIANSSYSWWAAWLNENQDKMVVAPKSRWFGSALSHHKLDDLFPKKWVLL
jgi:hypothetical protein